MNHDVVISVDAAESAGEIEDLEIVLFDWQREALLAWTEHNCKGAVEAVTGAGKTRVGLAAVQLAINRGYEALVIVPTKELLHQWKEELERHLDVPVGLAGDGSDNWFESYDVVVATIHTAKNKRDEPVTYMRLLVADECHRYAAEGWALALTDDYEWRLGLTATYARPDGRHTSVLDAYFGGVIFTLWYERALRDELIAQFEIGFVSVRLSPDDEIKYFEIEEKRSSFYRNLRRFVEHDPGPTELMALVNTWADSPGFESHQRIARGYRSVLQERRRLLAESKTKIDALQLLGEPVLDAQGTLVFTDTQESARRAAEALMAVGSSAIAVYSDLEKSERERAISTFRKKEISALVAPKILDEGIDVPDADLGILLASNRSRRQLVQRMGRVLRKKTNGSHARILVFYAQGTNEDPRYVGIENLEHFSEILPFARRFEYFDIEHDLAELIEFLRANRNPLETEISIGGETPIVVPTDLKPLVAPEPGHEHHTHDVSSGDETGEPFVPEFGWLLRKAIQHGHLKIGEELVCNRERTRDFGDIRIEANGEVWPTQLSHSISLTKASRLVIGLPLPNKSVLKSWETVAGVTLWAIWELLLEEPEQEDLPTVPSRQQSDLFGGSNRRDRAEGVSPETSGPAGAPLLPPNQGKSIGSGTQTEMIVELVPHGAETLLVLRVGKEKSLQILLDRATAGALGGQLLSVSHLPLQSPYSVKARWVPQDPKQDRSSDGPTQHAAD